MENKEKQIVYGKVAVQLKDGSEIFINIPYMKDAPPPDFREIVKFARAHPETKLWLWDGENLRQL
jgi:hypothetical protein